MAESLQDAGYDVVEAENGDEAAKFVESSPTKVLLLVTDIHMPGSLDGIAFAEKAAGIFPDMPIIYTTGRPDVMSRVKRLGGNRTLLQKPYTPTQLINMVRSQLCSSNRARA